jgi:hypothetical protein
MTADNSVRQPGHLPLVAGDVFQAKAFFQCLAVELYALRPRCVATQYVEEPGIHRLFSLAACLARLFSLESPAFRHYATVLRGWRSYYIFNYRNRGRFAE